MEDDDEALSTSLSVSDSGMSAHTRDRKIRQMVRKKQRQRAAIDSKMVNTKQKYVDRRKEVLGHMGMLQVKRDHAKESRERDEFCRLSDELIQVHETMNAMEAQLVENLKGLNIQLEQCSLDRDEERAWRGWQAVKEERKVSGTRLEIKLRRERKIAANEEYRFSNNSTSTAKREVLLNSERDHEVKMQSIEDEISEITKRELAFLRKYNREKSSLKSDLRQLEITMRCIPPGPPSPRDSDDIEHLQQRQTRLITQLEALELSKDTFETEHKTPGGDHAIREQLQNQLHSLSKTDKSITRGLAAIQKERIITQQRCWKKRHDAKTWTQHVSEISQKEKTLLRSARFKSAVKRQIDLRQSEQQYNEVIAQCRLTDEENVAFRSIPKDFSDRLSSMRRWPTSTFNYSLVLLRRYVDGEIGTEMLKWEFKKRNRVESPPVISPRRHTRKVLERAYQKSKSPPVSQQRDLNKNSSQLGMFSVSYDTTSQNYSTVEFQSSPGKATLSLYITDQPQDCVADVDTPFPNQNKLFDKISLTRVEYKPLLRTFEINGNSSCPSPSSATLSCRSDLMHRLRQLLDIGGVLNNLRGSFSHIRGRDPNSTINSINSSCKVPVKKLKRPLTCKGGKMFYSNLSPPSNPPPGVQAVRRQKELQNRIAAVKSELVFFQSRKDSSPPVAQYVPKPPEDQALVEAYDVLSTVVLSSISMGGPLPLLDKAKGGKLLRGKRTTKTDYHNMRRSLYSA